MRRIPCADDSVGGVLMKASDNAAAMWGMSENPIHGLDARLHMAHQALDFFGSHYEWVEAMLEDAPEEIYLVEDWHSGKPVKLVRFNGGEETAVYIMDKNPGRFIFTILKSVSFPVEVE